MNDVLRKVVGWFKKVFTRKHVVVPAPREKKITPHGAKHRYKGRTKGAFGNSKYYRAKQRTPMARVRFEPLTPEQTLKARRRRRHIRRLIAAA